MRGCVFVRGSGSGSTHFDLVVSVLAPGLVLEAHRGPVSFEVMHDLNVVLPAAEAEGQEPDDDELLLERDREVRVPERGRYRVGCDASDDAELSLHRYLGDTDHVPAVAEDLFIDLRQHPHSLPLGCHVGVVHLGDHLFDLVNRIPFAHSTPLFHEAFPASLGPFDRQIYQKITLPSRKKLPVKSEAPPDQCGQCGAVRIGGEKWTTCPCAASCDACRG